MDRTPEPELMDDPAQAAAYAAANFEAPDRRFIETFIALYGTDFQGEIADLGCGPGNIALPLAGALPAVRVLGIDGAAAMLHHARLRSAAAGEPGTRVEWLCTQLPADLPVGRFAAVVSNSLLHHLHDPAVLWATLQQIAAPGAAVLVADLRRPPSPEAAAALQAQYTAGEPAVLQADFLASLHAAFEVEEVQAQLAAAGLTGLTVEAVGDRHLRIWGRLDKPGIG